MAASLVSVPVVGMVAAGRSILAEENITGQVLVESDVVRSGQHFALRAVGDSMIGAGINDGDLIIVRQQPIAEDGDIVVALLNNEATVKRLKIKDELIELVPENPEVRKIRIRPEDDLRVLGKVVGWKRSKPRQTWTNNDKTTGVFDGNFQPTPLFEAGDAPANRQEASHCLSGASCRLFFSSRRRVATSPAGRWPELQRAQSHFADPGRLNSRRPCRGVVLCK
jgi:hypothetical protein